MQGLIAAAAMPSARRKPMTVNLSSLEQLQAATAGAHVRQPLILDCDRSLPVSLVPFQLHAPSCLWASLAHIT